MTTTTNLNADVDFKSAHALQDRAFSSFKTVVPDYQRWLADPQVGARPKVSPLTGLALPPVKQTPEDQVAEIFADAALAQEPWHRRSVQERSKFLRDFVSLMWKYEKEILDVIQWETGKPRKHAFEEILDVSINIGYYSAKGPGILRTQKTSGALPLISTARVAHLPVGVVGVIAPWNYPFTLAISDALAALIAGNTVVLKPASQTPLSAVIIASLLERSGLPPHVYQLVPGPGSTIGDKIVEHADFVMFTGSTEVGKSIAEACGRRLVGCSAELGGKNPSIIFPDADLKKWAKTAGRESFSSSGQLCVSIERMYIHEDVWDEALELLLQHVEALIPGRDFSWETGFGPLVDLAQLKTVEDQVADAVSKGATILTGGEAMPELGATGFQPTLLTDVTADMEVFANETFGPVVSLYKWNNYDQVIAEANDTTYGLNGSVWSRDRALAEETARQIKTGSVSINESYGATWGAIDAPIGGMRQSGLGRRHGHAGLLKYTESQTITTGPPSLDPWFGMPAKTWAAAERTVIRARNLLWRACGS